MSALTAFGRHRNVAISCDAIPQIIDGVQSLDVVRIEGEESLETSSFCYKVLLKTPPELAHFTPDSLLARFDMSSFLGQTATTHIALDGFGSFIYGENATTDMTPVGAGERQITGIIEAAQFKRIAERSAFFEITIRDWLWLGTQNKNYRVFQNQTHLDTILQVLESYPYPVEQKINTTYPLRDYCIQYGESDEQLVRRLCAENGITIGFRHADGVCTLVLSDNNAAFKPFTSEAYHELRFHANADRVDEEVFHTFSPTVRLTTGAVVYRDYSYVAPKATNEVICNEGRQDKSGKQIRHADAEQYHFQSDAFTNLVQPRAGTGETNKPEEEGKLYTLAHFESLQQHGKRIYAAGNLRAVVTGCTAKVYDHPQRDCNAEYLIVSSTLIVEEISHESQRIDAFNKGQAWRVETSAILQPANVMYRPERNIPKPSVYSVETAKVVGNLDEDEGDGEGGNAVWTDDLGRIKIQFPWDRQGQSDQNSSCWVRVVSNDAGNQMGSVHLPRIGSEVVISFIKGDPDLPICTGSVYNADNMPPWQLPANQALSGYRSRELSPGNQSSGMSNHLILDDSKGELQTQLKSDFKSTSLSLGSVTRIDSNKGRREKRGFGWELRSEGHGVLRATDGMYITTYARPDAAKHITDLKETGEQLTKAQEQHESMSDVAIDFGAHDKGDQDKVSKVIKEQNTEIKGTGEADPQAGQFPELKAPHLVVSSPAGIETSTPKSTHIWSGEHIALTSGDHTSMSVGKSLLASAVDTIRFFVYKAGMRMVAAAGDIDIKALKDSVNVLAKLNITHTANKITITAKEEVMIIGGGSYTKWNAGTIESGTNGLHIEYAGSHSMTGPKSTSAALPRKKPGKGNLELFHQYADDANKVLGYFDKAGYKVTDVLGQVKKGKLDSKGFAAVSGLAPGPVKILFEPDPRDAKSEDAPYNHPYPFVATNPDGIGGLGGALAGLGSLAGIAGGVGSLVNASGLQQALNMVQKGVGLAQAYEQGGAQALLSSVLHISGARATSGVSAVSAASARTPPFVHTSVDASTLPAGRMAIDI